MSTEWLVEEHEPGWFGRLISPHGGGRPGTAAVVLGAAAAVAFALSLVFKWGTVTVTQTTVDGAATENTAVFPATVTNMISLSMVYLLGMVALLGLVGAVVTLPDLALRLRLAAIGVTAGMVAVMIGATFQMPSVATLGGSGLSETKSAFELGLFFGYAATVLPLAAIWLAARPAQRVEPTPTRVVEEPDLDEGDEVPFAPLPRGLSVSGGPMDLTVTPG
jgi:hypothetical protein